MEWTQHSNEAVFHLNGAKLSISFPVCGGVRLRQPGPSDEWCPILEGEMKYLDLTIERAEDVVCVDGGEMSVCLSESGEITILRSGQRLWYAPAMPREAQGWNLLKFSLAPQERIYGLGQDPEAHLDHNGQERRMWNQWGGHARSGNDGIGFFISSVGYALFLNTPAAARFRFGRAPAPELDPLGEAMVPSPFPPAASDDWGEVQSAAPLDVFVLPGTAEEALAHYYALTGFPKLPPKWAFGFLQCKNRYMNGADLLYTGRELRRFQIPCDGLIIDWLWFCEFGDLAWNEIDWPHPERMLSELAQMGFRVVSAQHPFISENSCHYDEDLSRGYLNTVPDGKRITYDHTNPAARQEWWRRTAALYRQGIRGYWTDMGELEEHFDDTHSYAGGRTLTHNAYSLLWSKGLYEGQKCDFGTRAFILSRSCCAGIQKYGTTMWSGDINATWQVLREQIVIGQGMAMSGMPWWCTDIGGFLSGDECTAELYIRWMEWGVFCALFRTHGTRPHNEPWTFGPGPLPTIRSVIELRYTLLPTLYSLAVACALTGRPMIRPMAVAFPDDLECARLEGQFVVGDNLLVAPVMERGARAWRVYLPEGRWIHYWSGQLLPSGWHTVPAPLGQIPFFVRAGAVLPVFGKLGRCAAECGDLCGLLFPGGDGSFSYYDEDGETEAYLQGGYTQVKLTHCNGNAAIEVMHGQAPALRFLGYAPRQTQLFTLDASWCADEAIVTLTLLKDAQGQLSIEPDKGWEITGCSLEREMKEIYTPAYHCTWSGEWSGRAGDTVRWTLVHTAPLRRLCVPQACVTLTDGNDASESHSVQWDHAALSEPLLLGCHPQGTYSMEEVTNDQELRLPWRRDVCFAHNPFGYVDLRRLDPARDGERIFGEAWARENLFSYIPDQSLSLDLRHDSPLTVWLNGKLVYDSSLPNVCRAPLHLTLLQGKNQLLLRSRANIERPYSGGEFGYSLTVSAPCEVYVQK